MLKWNTQKHHLSVNNGQQDVFADISTRYVTDIQCAIDAKILHNDNIKQKVMSCNGLMN